MSRRTIDRIAAFASSVVLSTPTVWPESSFFAWAIESTNSNTSANTSSGSRLRVLVRVEWSGVGSASGMPRNCRNARLSAHRQAMPRWLPRPSK